MTNTLAYASLLRRYQALVLDSLIIVPVFVGAMFVPGIMGLGPAATQTVFVATIGLCILYEPLQVSMRRGTLGHYHYGLLVQDASSASALGFWRALGRSSLKALLGVPSLVFLLVTRRAQSLHDLAFRSVVVVADARRATALDVATPDPVPSEGMPSRARRVLVIIAWSVTTSIAVGTTQSLLSSPSCFEADVCSAGERLWLTALDLAWVVACGVILVSGWRGRLPGCQRRAVAEVAANHG